MSDFTGIPETRDHRSDFFRNFKRLWRQRKPAPQSVDIPRQIATNEPNLRPVNAVHCSGNPLDLADDMQKKSQQASMWNAMRMATPDRPASAPKNGPRKVMGFEGKVASARKERLEKKSSERMKMDQSSARTMFR